MCLYPKVLLNPKYKANKKNGGNVPVLPDERVKYVPIGCQECIECRKQKSRQWQTRLLEDIKTNKTARFVTLTFSNESIKKLLEEIDKYNKYNGLQPLDGYDLDNQIAKWSVHQFLNRWRKQYGKSIRHWLVTELGHNGTENVHLHGLLWTSEPQSVISSKWQYGYVWAGQEVLGKVINYVNDRTIGYITKYVTKIDPKHKGYKPVILTSPGIGSNYINTINAIKNKYNGINTREVYYTGTGNKIGLPIYYRNKIYSEKEREQLWLQKLDKQERWIRGEKISIRDGEENYYKQLEWHRLINKQLGYGDGEKDWERETYEKQRRAIMLKTRIQNSHKKK